MKEFPITFKSKGKQLVGVLHLPKRKMVPVIVMCHGFTACKLGTPFGLFVEAARYWCRNGFAVLRFDFRGCGDSEGKFEDYCLRVTVEDTRNAIEFLNTVKSIDKNRVGIVGHSRGGATAIVTASEGLVKCLVTWSSVANFWHFFSLKEVKEIEKSGFLVWKGFKVGRTILKDLDYDLRDCVTRLKVPSMFVHGEKDEVVDAINSLMLFKWCKAKKSFRVIKNADHFFSDPKQRKKLLRITLRWFRENLSK